MLTGNSGKGKNVKSHLSGGTTATPTRPVYLHPVFPGAYGPHHGCHRGNYTVDDADDQEVDDSGSIIVVVETSEDITSLQSLDRRSVTKAMFYSYSPEAGFSDYSGYMAAFAPDLKSITIEIQDGGFGCMDGAVNGVIVGSYGTGPGSGGDSGCFLKVIRLGPPGKGQATH